MTNLHRTISALTLLASTGVGSATAQSGAPTGFPTPPPAPEAAATLRRVVGASMGSALGLVVGNALGSGTAWEDGEDPSSLEFLVFAGVASSLGAALGLQATSSGSLGLTEALRAAFVGMAVSGASVWLAHEVTDGRLEGEGLLLGYAVGQGIVAAALLPVFGR